MSPVIKKSRLRKYAGWDDYEPTPTPIHIPIKVPGRPPIPRGDITTPIPALIGAKKSLEKYLLGESDNPTEENLQPPTDKEVDARALAATVNYLNFPEAGLDFGVVPKFMRGKITDLAEVSDLLRPSAKNKLQELLDAGYKVNYEDAPKYQTDIMTPYNDMIRGKMSVTDNTGKTIAYNAHKQRLDDTLETGGHEVLDKRDRRKGLARFMYESTEDIHNLPFRPSSWQSKEGRAVWVSPNRTWGIKGPEGLKVSSSSLAFQPSDYMSKEIIKPLNQEDYLKRMAAEFERGISSPTEVMMRNEQKYDYNTALSKLWAYDLMDEIKSTRARVLNAGKDHSIPEADPHKISALLDAADKELNKIKNILETQDMNNIPYEDFVKVYQKQYADLFSEAMNLKISLAKTISNKSP